MMNYIICTRCGGRIELEMNRDSGVCDTCYRQIVDGAIDDSECEEDNRDLERSTL